jgi:hypothetical protein
MIPSNHSGLATASRAHLLMCTGSGVRILHANEIVHSLSRKREHRASAAFFCGVF